LSKPGQVIMQNTSEYLFEKDEDCCEATIRGFLT